MYNVLIQNIFKKNSDQEEGRERCDVGFGIAWPQGMGVVGGTNWEFMWGFWQKTEQVGKAACV